MCVFVTEMEKVKEESKEEAAEPEQTAWQAFLREMKESQQSGSSRFGPEKAPKKAKLLSDKERGKALKTSRQHDAASGMNISQYLCKRYQEVYFRLVHPDARPPQRATSGSVGFDLFSTEFATILPGCTKRFDLGVVLDFKHDGIYAKISSRSGLACEQGVEVVGSGIIDTDYQQPIMVVLKNLSNHSYTVSRGARIAQLIFFPFHRVQLKQYGEKKEALQSAPLTREGGFGSTGE